MVIHSAVSLKRLVGSSLIEFMIAAMLGSIALIIVSGVYVSAQKSATNKIKQILLIQNMSSVLQQLKEDVQRAGFNGEQLTSAKLMDSTTVVEVDSENSRIGYVYKIFSNGNEKYRHVVYRLDTSGDNLVLCEKHHTSLLSVAQAADSGFKGNCYSIFDSQEILVKDFSMDEQVLENVAKTSLITLHLTAALATEPRVEHSMKVQLKQRNWL